MTNSKPKVLFVSRRWPPSTGGMERFAFDLYKSLKSRADITLYKWGGRSIIWLAIVLPVFFVRSVWTLMRKDIDVIHMQDGVMSFMGVTLKFIFRKPLVVVIHGLDVTYDNIIFKQTILRSLNKADRIISISQAAADEAVKRGVSRDKITVIPLGITDELHQNEASSKGKVVKNYGLPSDAKILLSVGRLVERKGVNWFTSEVMPELVSRDNKVYYMIVGDGDEKSKIETTIKKKELQNNVHLLGRIGDSELRNLYNAADAFVMPNIPVAGDMEGFGRVLLEAALCETVVIASGIEGIKDAIIHGENGILVKPRDKTQYVKETRSVLEDKVRATKFAKAARNYSLKRYSWESASNGYIKAYLELID